VLAADDETVVTRVFITGASSGIGEALAREYRRRHPQALIGLTARRAGELERVAAALGGRVLCLPADVAERTSLAQAAQRFLAEAGTPDVVVANAGISAATRLGEPGDSEVFERILRTNVLGLVDTFASFLPAMRAAGAGRLVGIASVAGVRGLPGAAAYSASKAAAIACLESLRVELRGTGLRVVTIAPGFIRTPMTAANRFPMPFLTEVDVFAARAVDAIAAGRAFAVVPEPMAWVARGLRLLPPELFDRAFARAPRKGRG
jgi:NAD(P)-dependent dehydrogenase (short-subunit alcohol dehydrogenase family)